MGPGGPFMMRFHQFPMMEQQPQPSQPQQPMNGMLYAISQKKKMNHCPS